MNSDDATGAISYGLAFVLTFIIVMMIGGGVVVESVYPKATQVWVAIWMGIGLLVVW